MAANPRYIYVDIHNKPAFTVERYIKKDGHKGYAFSHVNSDGEPVRQKPKFENGAPLYNLYQLINSKSQCVYVVEGEKCSDALSKLGFLVTTSNGGAQNAQGTDWKPLAGRDVVIWPDNDDGGSRYADDVTAILQALDCSVKRIDVAPLELPHKGDCADWLEHFRIASGKEATKADVEALPCVRDATQDDISPLSKADQAWVLPPDNYQAIAHLATLDTLRYSQARKQEAKKLGVPVGVLDRLVKDEQKAHERDNSPFSDIEPWHEPISPAQLLDEITATILRFIVLDKHQAQAAALWVTACWFVNEIHFAPIALINAPERACGKTQLLTVLGKLAPRAIQAGGISQAALYRSIEKFKPTLFIDEIETVLKDNEPLRGLLNVGYTRDSSKILRCVGDDSEPKTFDTWCMKAIAGINAIKLAETVTSRAIIFELRRKRTDEKVERLRQAEAGLFETLASKLARFSDDYSSQILTCRPMLPDKLGDRDQDNWEPLLQVASVAGDHWLDTAINTALKLSCEIQAPMSSATELLSDIQEIFQSRKTIKITTTDLINALCEDTEKSWATYNKGRQLTPKQLASKLKGYGIASKTTRINSYEIAKGYEAKQFDDAFSRYLTDPENEPSQSNNSLEANSNKGLNVTDKKTVTVTGIERVTAKPAPALDCDGVTDKKPVSGGASASINSRDDQARF